MSLAQLRKRIQNIAYLTVVFKPFWSDFGDSVILLRWAALDTSESHWLTLSHGSQEIVVDVLLQGDSFL